MTDKGKEYLKIGKKQSINQQMLIQEILDAFSAEVESLNTFETDPLSAPDALLCAKEVVDTLLPIFLLNDIHLQLHPDIDAFRNWKVVGEKSRLERVLTNLIENALRYSPPYSSVTVNLKEDGDYLLITVEDEGYGVSQDIAKTLFQKFSQGKDKPGRSRLGLIFLPNYS